MRAHVLLHLLTSLGKKDKMRGFPRFEFNCFSGLVQ